MVQQSILIHSATGGVGIACIQLARYKKAEVSQISFWIAASEKYLNSKSNMNVDLRYGWD